MSPDHPVQLNSSSQDVSWIQRFNETTNRQGRPLGGALETMYELLEKLLSDHAEDIIGHGTVPVRIQEA